MSLALGARCHFTKKTAAVAKKGMRELLNIHNEEEFETLCDAAGVSMMPTRSRTLDAIFSEHLTTFDDYRNLLSFMWEGIIIEYLRRIGKRVSNFREDPRVTVLRLWLEDERFQVKGFSRVYVPVTTKRDEIESWETSTLKVAEYMKVIRDKEKILKHMERRITKNDYRTTLIFFRILAEIRVVEDNFRTYLLEEVRRSHGAEADAIEKRDRTIASYDVQTRVMRENVEDMETQYFTHTLYYDLASDSTATCAWHEKQQRHLVRDIYSYRDEIDALKEELRLQKLANSRLRMKYEDMTESHARLVKKLDVDVFNMREALFAEMGMSQRECSNYQRINRQMRYDMERLRERSNEEIERLRMEVEECNQRYGKRRRRARGRTKKRGKSKMKKKSKNKTPSSMKKNRAGKKKLTGSVRRTKLPAIGKGRKTRTGTAGSSKKPTRAGTSRSAVSDSGSVASKGTGRAYGKRRGQAKKKERGKRNGRSTPVARSKK